MATDEPWDGFTDNRAMKAAADAILSAAVQAPSTETNNELARIDKTSYMWTKEEDDRLYDIELMGRTGTREPETIEYILDKFGDKANPWSLSSYIDKFNELTESHRRRRPDLYGLPKPEPGEKRLNIVKCSEAPDPPEPLLQNGPRAGELSLMVSESGKGKSFFLLSLAVSFATGTAHLPSISPLSQGRVLYLSYEDSASYLRNRLDAIDPVGGWRRAEDAGDLLIVEEPESIFALKDRKMALTEGGQALEKAIQEYRPRMVVLDPLSGVAGVEDENNNAALHYVADQIARMAKRYNCAFILSHHAGKAEASTPSQNMARGASSLASRSRLMWVLTNPPKDDDPNLVVLSCVKHTHGPMHSPILLERGSRGSFTEKDYNQYKQSNMDELSHILAQTLGENQADWGITEIVRGDAGKDFRTALKSKNKYLVREMLTKVYNHAVENGYIVEHMKPTGGTPKRVPRAKT